MSSYNITAYPGLSLHGQIFGAKMLRDEDESNKQELDVHVYSGDYFVTLATELDKISQEIQSDNPNEHLRLQQLIDDLLYMQHKYKIAKKSKK